MCFSSSPQAPTSHPAYAPEDAYQHFQVTEKPGEGEDKKITPQGNAKRPSAPSSKPRDDSIRM